MTKQRPIPENPPCYCGNSQPYNTCCQLLHHGQAAPNAEILMRSRYSAYVLNLPAYLLQTWHDSSRPAAEELALDMPIEWLGLALKRSERIGPDRATVEFVARYKLNGKAYKLHEVSEFMRVGGKWFYLKGSFPE